MALRALAGVASATISLANIDAGLGISDYYYMCEFAASRGAVHWHALDWAPVRHARLYSDSMARARAAVQIQCVGVVRLPATIRSPRLGRSNRFQQHRAVSSQLVVTDVASQTRVRADPGKSYGFVYTSLSTILEPGWSGYLAVKSYCRSVLALVRGLSR